MNDDIKNNLSDEMKSFVDNYRTALGEQYTADTNALANQRNIDHTTIMSGANRSGLLHKVQVSEVLMPDSKFFHL